MIQKLGPNYGWPDNLTMLYERWRQIASERHGEIALRDSASGRRWTFGELFAAGDGAPVSDPARCKWQGRKRPVSTAALG